MAEDKIEAIKKVSKTPDTQSVHEEQVIERVPPNKDHFDALLTATTKKCH